MYLEETLEKKRRSSGVDFLRVPAANFEVALAEASRALAVRRNTNICSGRSCRKRCHG